VEPSADRNFILRDRLIVEPPPPVRKSFHMAGKIAIRPSMRDFWIGIA
jgi:hypothetical protein